VLGALLHPQLLISKAAAEYVHAKFICQFSSCFRENEGAAPFSNYN